jgi:hypothetical protein
MQEVIISRINQPCKQAQYIWENSLHWFGLIVLIAL